MNIPSRQSGSIILALMLIVITVSSYVLITQLNASTMTFIRSQDTTESLSRAKSALIAYSVTFPDIWSRNAANSEGPGYLPCPDTTNNGSPNPSCGPNAIGRLPGEWLGVSDYLDASGERLWYAVSDAFRNQAWKTVPMNSDVAGQFSIDTNNDGIGDITDVVAVIIAPGPPVSNVVQMRTPANINSVAGYLEGENSDGDAVFAQFSGGGNDTLLFITRQELMRAVEKRVLGDMDQILTSYSTAPVNAYPYLAAFDPTTTDYDSTDDTATPTNIREGQLGFNDIDEIFRTDFTIDWLIDEAGSNGSPFAFLNGTATVPDWYTIHPVLTVDQESPVYGTADTINGPACTWTQQDAVNCNGRAQDPDNVHLPFTVTVNASGTPVDFDLTVSVARVYDFLINLPQDGNRHINADPATGLRLRDMRFTEDALEVADGASIQMTITDTLPVSVTSGFITVNIDVAGNVTASSASPDSPVINVAPDTIVVQDTNTINTTTTNATIKLNNIIYDLGVGDGIPQWFITNNWHQQIYMRISQRDIPGALSPCNPGVECIQLTGSYMTSNSRAVAVIAGQDLTGSRPSTVLGDYFEGENASANDNIFVRGNNTDHFNDQIKIIAAAP